MAFHDDFLHRVPIERAVYLGLVIPFLVEIGGKYLCQLESVALAGVEIHLDGLAIDTGQQSLNEIGADVVARNPEA